MTDYRVGPGNTQIVVETDRLAIDPVPAKVIPFHLKKVPPPQVLSAETQECLDLIDLIKGRILTGEYAPTGLVIGVVEVRDDVEESFAVSCGLTRMEIIGNLHALATEITLEGSQ